MSRIHLFNMGIIHSERSMTKLSQLYSMMQGDAKCLLLLVVLAPFVVGVRGHFGLLASLTILP